MVCSETCAKKTEIKIYHLKQKKEILLKTIIQTFIIFWLLLTSKSLLKQCSSKCNWQSVGVFDRFSFWYFESIFSLGYHLSAVERI